MNCLATANIHVHVHENDVMVGPDKPVIPGQLF